MSTTASSSTSTTNEYSITQFKPCNHTSPLDTTFISDKDTILLDPSRYDPNAEIDGGVGSSSSSNLTATTTTTPSLGGSNNTLQLAGPRRKIFFPDSATIAIITCGGVCPGLNNVIRSIVNISWYRYNIRRILGIRYGYLGMIKNTHTLLTPDSVKDIHLFGGTILGTSRGAQDTKKMVEYLINNKVDILFTIGGDGTQRGAHEIAKEIKTRNLLISIIGIGKTIDNDLLYLDKSFGFDTAVELSQRSLISAHEEARAVMNGIGIVKLMGRESGAIAMNASIASGDVNVVLIPEIKFSLDELIAYLKERFRSRDHCLIVAAEGAGQDIAGESGRVDKSGNKIFTDIGEYLKKEIGIRLKADGIEHTIKYIDPSYSIRAGVANATDAILCTMYAQMAVHAAMAGKTDMMVGMVNSRFVHLPLSKVTQGRKSVDVRGVYWQALNDATGSPFRL